MQLNVPIKAAALTMQKEAGIVTTGARMAPRKHRLQQASA